MVDSIPISLAATLIVVLSITATYLWMIASSDE